MGVGGVGLFVLETRVRSSRPARNDDCNRRYAPGSLGPLGMIVTVASPACNNGR